MGIQMGGYANNCVSDLSDVESIQKKGNKKRNAAGNKALWIKILRKMLRRRF
jgi:hypothetical protein